MAERGRPKRRWSFRPSSGRSWSVGAASETAQALALRSRIVLGCAEGLDNRRVAAGLGVHEATVGKWRRRFLERGPAGLLDEPRPGAPRSVSDEKVEEIVRATLEEQPADATHWSTRSMARRAGVSQSTVSRIWRAFALQPHRIETFKISTDPLFIEKVRDVVGLYLDPPERALVLCVDEKSQIQALNRSQPVLPILPGTPARASHDYVRHGTTSLFAALDVASGQVISKTYARHRAAEFKQFLDRLEEDVPAQLEVHLILDNYATHKTPAIQRWLARHPRFVFHFLPKGASWLNLIERWFAELTTKLLQRGVHTDVKHSRPTSPAGRRLERQPASLPLAQNRRRDPHQPRPISRANLGLGTLEG